MVSSERMILSLGFVVSLAVLLIAQPERNTEPDRQVYSDINGYVTDTLGRSRGNVCIAHQSANIWSGVRSDKYGRFKLEEVKPGQKNWIAFSQASKAFGLFSIPGNYAGEPVHVVLSYKEAEADGRVVGPDGKGLAERKVELVVRTDQGLAYSFQYYKKTDQYGNYTHRMIPCGSGLSIQARLTDANEAERQYITESYDLHEDEIFIQMPQLVIGEGRPPQTDDGKKLYSGRIVNEQEEPIESVRVTLSYQGRNSIYWCKEVMTDEDGRWQRRLPNDLFDFSIDLLHPEYIRQSCRRISTTELLEGTNVLMMKRGLTLRGVVKNQRGEPVENALIDIGGVHSISDEGELIENCTSPRTLADGSFSVGGLAPVSIQIVASAVGYAPCVIPVDVVESMEPIKVVLKSGRAYTGQVVGVDGNPIEGVEIDVDDWAVGSDRYSIARITRTDSQGYFRIEDLPDEGKVVLDFGKRSSGLLSFSKEIPEDVSETDIIVMYKKPVFTGKVIDAETGKPVVDFSLVDGVRWNASGESLDWESRGKHGANSKDGTFSETWDGYISYPFNGLCCLKVEADGYLSETAPLFELGKEYEPCVIRLQKAEPLRGIVVDQNESPVTKAEVAWVEPGKRAFIKNGKFSRNAFVLQTEIITATDSAGLFELPSSRDEGLIVAVHKSGYVSVVSGDFKNGDKIRLIPWAKIEGTVLFDKTDNEEFVLGISRATIPGEIDSQRIEWLFDRTVFSGKVFTIDFVPSVPLCVGQVSKSGFINPVDINPQPGRTYHISFGDKGVVSADREQASLTGKSLPDFENIKIEFEPNQVDDKMILVCFFDMNQRPSRRFISQINEQIEQLREKGVAVIGIQASKADEGSLKEWIKSSNVSFPVGIVEDDEEQTRFKWGVKSLPWLILTDKEHIVTAEGFGIEDMDGNI